MNKFMNVLGIVLIIGLGTAIAQNTFPATGSVGIGTTSPANTLDVNGGINMDTGTLNLPNGDSTKIDFYGTVQPNHSYIVTSPGYAVNLYTNGIQSMTWSNGNVGIGTTNPSTPLQVTKQYSGNTNIPMQTWDPNITGYGLTLSNYNSISGIDYRFSQLNGGVAYPVMTFSSGNVGIGTTTPQAQLDINGNVKLSGSITFPDGIQTEPWNGTTLGGDYAESIDVLGDRKAYEPGDVIVIDDSVTGKFDKSDKAYSKLVAGVYSTKPGLVGRRVTADRPDKVAEVPMAMMGIVPTKVTTENGPIERGDLLVSSSKPGYAMKGTDRDRLTGAVIGKALAPLKSGSGVVEVLLALQ